MCKLTTGIILTIIILCSCSEDEKIKNFKEYEGPMLEVNNVQSLYSDSAIVRVKLEAPKQLEYGNGDRKFPEGVYIEFYDKQGAVTSTIEADTGYYFNKKNQYKAVGNVFIENIKKNQTLSTEELYWDPDKEKIYTDAYVKIVSDGEPLTGHGLTANQNFSEYTIHDPSGTMTIEENDNNIP